MVSNQSKNTSNRTRRTVVCQTNNVKHVIKQTQQYMSTLTENLNYDPFNNTVNKFDCVDRLISHRITSKFHIEVVGGSDRLVAETFNNYVTYDSKLSLETDLWSSYRLRAARVLLHKWFRNFSVDVCAIRFEVTPGETFIPSKGEVSLKAKLFNKNHWTTTANCLDDTCVFIYNNAVFKRAARLHIGRVTRRDKRKLYMRYRSKADVGFRIFKHLLIDRVLTIVDGARAATVPKSNEKRRFINIEAMFPVILQRAAAQEILRVLAREGNDLGNTATSLVADHFGVKKPELSAQALHGRLISDRYYSTIDFSNASDSVTVSAVCSLFPKRVYDYLLKCRSHYVEIDGSLYEPIKLSSMGNGFTFETMTAMLYAIASVSSEGECRVYGDDVIIPSTDALDFVRTCSLINFNVNADKTFINSFFRESCGYFYSDYHGYITSFDFGQIKNLSDVIITCNKLTVIIEANQASPELLELLVETRDRINALVHASRKGPLPSSEYMQRRYLALYIFDVGYVKKQRRSKDLRALRQHYIEKNAWHFENCQIDESEVGLTFCPFFVPSVSKNLHTKAVDERMNYLVALYSGRRVKSVVKGKGKWVDIPCFVDPDGTVTLISNLITQNNVWSNRLEGVLDAHQKR